MFSQTQQSHDLVLVASTYIYKSGHTPNIGQSLSWRTALPHDLKIRFILKVVKRGVRAKDRARVKPKDNLIRTEHSHRPIGSSLFLRYRFCQFGFIQKAIVLPPLMNFAQETLVYRYK